MSSPLRLALCAALVLLPAVALAQPRASDAIAEVLFREGRALIKDGKPEEACPKFEESQRRDPKIGTLLNLAHCHEAIGKTATAWSEFTSAASIAGHKQQQDREDFALERAAKLEALLSRVRIEAAPGTEVSLDGETLDATSLAIALPVDPGEHRVVASAPGKQSWSTAVSVPAGPAEIRVAIPPLEDAPEDVVVVPPVEPLAPAPTAPRPVAVPPEESSSVSPLVWAGFGVAGAGLLVGAITGGLALSEGGALDCPDNACSRDQADGLSKANTLANVSNAAFVIAGLGAGVGVVGLFLSGGDAEAPVEARLGPASLSIHGTF